MCARLGCLASGLQFLLTGHRYYFYSEEFDAVSTAELCCHTLLIDDDSRQRSYCLFLLSHVDVNEDDFREQAVKYGLEDEIDALLRYLETHGEVDDEWLPEWDGSRNWQLTTKCDYPETERRRRP